MYVSASQAPTGGRFRPAASSAAGSGSSALEALVPTQLVRVGQGQEAPAPEPVETPKPHSTAEIVAQLQEIASKANASFRHSQTHLQFEIGSSTGRIIVRIIDTMTEEVIRTIPPEELIRISDRLDQVRGLLFDAQG